MKNIFDVLKESHEKQRLLLDALMETSGDSPLVKSFITTLKRNSNSTQRQKSGFSTRL
ncbi:hypothetical protein NI375_00390 [Vibrio alginolyticus]|nr:hypothetical protein NI375_00390 [Vibrio alginolyticus]